MHATIQDIATSEHMFALRSYGGCAPVPACAYMPNGRSQKTARKTRRRLSNAPRAIQRKYRFKEVANG